MANKILDTNNQNGIKKYYLDGEEIKESDYLAIKSYVNRFCQSCWKAKAEENRRLGQHFVVY